MKLFLPRRAALLAAVILGAAACDRKAPLDARPTPDAQTAPPEAQATPAPTPDKQGVVFGTGFYKEEVNPESTLRWVRQEAAFRVLAPAEGRYRLTFRPFTVFSTTVNTIDVSANGQPADSFSTHAFDLANPTPATVEVTLRAGENDLRLHSKGAEIRLGKNDDRSAAYGLVVPIGVERVP